MNFKMREKSKLGITVNKHALLHTFAHTRRKNQKILFLRVENATPTKML